MAAAMTRDEFVAFYTAHVNLTMDKLTEYGRAPFPCDCGHEECHGWTMDYVGEHEARRQAALAETARNTPEPI